MPPTAGSVAPASTVHSCGLRLGDGNGGRGGFRMTVLRANYSSGPYKETSNNYRSMQIGYTRCLVRLLLTDLREWWHEWRKLLLTFNLHWGRRSPGILHIHKGNPIQAPYYRHEDIITQQTNQEGCGETAATFRPRISRAMMFRATSCDCTVKGKPPSPQTPLCLFLSLFVSKVHIPSPPPHS